MIKKLLSGGALISIGTMLSYILGALRDIIFNLQYGKTMITDIYFSSFLVSDILYMVFISSALLGIVTPLYLKERNISAEKGFRLFGSFFTALWTVFFGVVLLALLFTPQIASVIFPEFYKNQPSVLVDLMRLILISNLIFSASNILGNFLMAHRNFISTAFSPVLYNIGIIVFVLLGAKAFGIYAAGYGAIFGSLLHLFFRIFEYFLIKERIKFGLNLSHPAHTELLISMFWKMGSIVVIPVSLLFLSSQADSYEGMYTTFTYVKNLESAPVAIFGIAFATASFPLLSQFFASGEVDKVQRVFTDTLRKILFWTIPSAVGVFFVGDSVMEIVYTFEKGTAAYEWMKIFIMIMAIAIVFEGLYNLFSRVFYASKDITTPLIAGGIFFLVFVSVILFGKVFGMTSFSAPIFFGMAYLLAYIAQNLFFIRKLSSLGIGLTRKIFLEIHLLWSFVSSLGMVVICLGIDLFFEFSALPDILIKTFLCGALFFSGLVLIRRSAA